MPLQVSTTVIWEAICASVGRVVTLPPVGTVRVGAVRSTVQVMVEEVAALLPKPSVADMR